MGKEDAARLAVTSGMMRSLLLVSLLVSLINAPALVVVRASAVNTPPVAGLDTLGTSANTAVDAPVVKLLANDTDADGDPLTLVTAGPLSTNGAVVALKGEYVTYSPPKDFIGEDRFTYVITDGQGSNGQGTVVVTIRPAGAPSPNRVSITLTSTGKLLRFTGVPGQAYFFQQTTAVPGSWTTLSPRLVADASGSIEYEDLLNPAPARRFYRTELAP